MNKSTLIRFRYDGDIWPVVEEWASEHHYWLRGSNGDERTYQKGTGILVAPMMLRVRKRDQETELEAWIRVCKFVRMRSLFILPREMGIESGDFRAVAPRRIARKAVSELLGQLGQPAIV